MTSLDLNREEFASKRRSEQDEFVERLQGVIGATFSTGDVEPLVSALENMYTEVYEAEVEGLTAALTPKQFKASLARFIKAAREMLSKADEKSSVRATSLALANAVLNDATAAAYEGEVEMEWVSMRDEDVRHTHEVADGQRRAVGEKFTVGESQMRFPGDITAPISEWINCRCSLRPIKASVTASTAPPAPEPLSVLFAGTGTTPAPAVFPDAPVAVSALAFVRTNSDGGRMIASEDVLSLADIFEMSRVDAERVAAQVVDASYRPLPGVQVQGDAMGQYLSMQVIDPDLAVGDAVVEWSGGEPGPAFRDISALNFAPEAIGEWLGLGAFGHVTTLAKHDLLFLENRRTPKIVPKGDKYEPTEAEGKITKRRAATEEEEETISKGDWVRVNEDGKKPGDDGYKEDRPSKVRPQNNAVESREVSNDERDDLADEGKALPDGSFPIANCSDLGNAIQAIGRAKDPDAAKAHIRKRKEALGCPDVELPDTWSTEPVTAAASKEGGEWLAVMAVPVENDAVHQIGPEDKHATVVYFGEQSDEGGIDAIKTWAHQIAADAQPFTAKVKGIEPLGHPGDDGQAMVWLLEDSDLNGIFEGVMSNEVVKRVYEDADTEKYDSYTPHVTIGYDRGDLEAGEDQQGLTDDNLDEASTVKGIAFDRLSVWHGGEHTDYTLGEPMPDSDEQVEPTTEEVEAVEQSVVEDSRIPFHGVLAPEGVASGDGRKFTNLGRTRDLPLPMTWQELSADGHDASITVGMIEKIEMIDGLMHYSGFFLSSVDEADEVIGLISEFGKFGVSVDADDIGSAAYDEATEMAEYDDPRVCSAAIVAIPAFMEAYIMLGPHPILDAETSVAASGQPALLTLPGVPESWKQAAAEQFTVEQAAAETAQADVTADAEAWAAIENFADVAPGKTEDGPGWLTHPVDTDRLRDYWVRGPGAAKIAWGVPGDFNRCRVNVGEYVKPQHLNGYCANRHYDALGVWPGREAAASETLQLSKTEPAPAISLVASAYAHEAPSEWFTEPVDLGYDDGVVITDEGRVMGYVAEWGVCHIGYDGICKEAPPSKSNYAYFATGEVTTPDGPVKVGVLTSATGHANPHLKAMPAAAHYDNTGHAWAMVACGENERGIWFSGMLHPNADPELLKDVVASGRISGDWRPIGNDLEMVAGLTVNVPGFPIIQTTAAAEDGRQLSLVAAGVHAPNEEESTMSVKDVDLSLIASLVVDEMDARQQRRDRFAAIKNEMEH